MDKYDIISRIYYLKALSMIRVSMSIRNKHDIIEIVVVWLSQENDWGFKMLVKGLLKLETK